jgi:phospholipase/lecithinase/hemolysin
MKKQLLIAGLCLSSGLLPTSAQASQIVNPPYSSVYTVGDSLVDPGNLYQQFPFLNIPQDPPYHQGRFSNGPVWSELLPARLGLTYNPSHNFSYGGAGAGNFHPTGLPLGTRQQVTNLIGTDGVVDPDGLYIISTGSNDYGSTDYTQIDIPGTVNNIIESVNRLSNAGAQNFLVVGVPNFAKLPAAKGSSPLELFQLGLVSTTHNLLLKTKLSQVATSQSLDINFFDLQATFNRISRNPQSYGLDNITDACLPVSLLELPDPLPAACSNPDRYLFWDDVHPSRKGHQLIAQLAARTIESNLGSASVPEGSSLFGILASAGFGYFLLSKKRES